MLELSEYESGGSSGNYDWIFTSPEVGRDSKIDNDDAANHKQVTNWRVSSPFAL